MRHLMIVAVMVVMFSASSASAFVSATLFTGKADNEYTTVIAGSAIVKGQWIVVAIDSQITASTITAFDTGVIGKTSPPLENYGLVIGVAEQSADTGQYVKVLTRGYTVAYVDGSDTSTGFSGIQAQSALSLTDKTGYAGAANGVSTADPTDAQAAATRICGYILNDVATADVSSLHRVYVVGR